MRTFAALLALLPLLLVTPSQAASKTYQARGLLRSYDSGKREAAIAHEEIPGYMSAMTMIFRVAEEEQTEDLRAGDSISFTLHVTAHDAWIDGIHKEGTATGFPFPAAKVTAGTELPLGEKVPDAQLVDDQGRTLFLHDFHGQPVAVTFIYLGCPLPTYCPLMNRNFQEAADLLTRLHLQDKVRLLSLSMDPANDTPEKLAAIASGYDAKRPLWTFASASDVPLRPLAAATGLQFTRLQGRIVHNLRTIILDRDGRLRHVFRGNSWSPQDLVVELRAAQADTTPSIPRE